MILNLRIVLGLSLLVSEAIVSYRRVAMGGGGTL